MEIKTIANNVVLALLSAVWLTAPVFAHEEPGPDFRYVFSWPFIDTKDMAPRGGTTKGPEVKLADRASDEWHALGEKGLSKKERDRRAILAMSGPYRASFDFLEVLGFSPGFAPQRPYRSWGTEYIYVLADQPDFISLQHIMVMVFKQEDGSESDPVVVKHWRQDWRYEDSRMHVYAGNRQWKVVRLEDHETTGRWTQAVYQVDDSPRYESIGAWIHTDDYSSWTSEETWRPLPRREFSVRDDYDVLIGTNRHTIFPDGWTHEEDNLKVAISGEREGIDPPKTIAREYGVNRYQRILDYDWSAGDRYWERTTPFWREVRKAWRERFRDIESLEVAERVDGESLVMKMLSMAEEMTRDGFDQEQASARIEAVLSAHISTGTEQKH